MSTHDPKFDADLLNGAFRRIFELTEPVDVFAEIRARQAEALESLWNAGARVADDCFCSCGARGYRSTCPACTADQNRAGR